MSTMESGHGHGDICRLPALALPMLFQPIGMGSRTPSNHVDGLNSINIPKSGS